MGKPLQAFGQHGLAFSLRRHRISRWGFAAHGVIVRRMARNVNAPGPGAGYFVTTRQS
jgi:hypothetical protein